MNHPGIWRYDYREFCQTLRCQFPVYCCIIPVYFLQVETAASEYRAIIPGFTAKDVVLPFTTDGGTSTIHFTTGKIFLNFQIIRFLTSQTLLKDKVSNFKEIVFSLWKVFT